jgi:UDP-N-acetylglucosamine--N-acetylmuramyl-(pentapeptide) pyrophosphoryl-undecaprenol N-acetylglucosamine transferase
MLSRYRNRRVIISGGGTGGHVFPAIAIADALKEKMPEIEILFIGAEGRLEMEKVPEAGYRIIGLPVEGFKRKLTFRNIIVVFKLCRSLMISGRIIKEFRPGAVVGVGGYASGPVLRSAARKGIPTVIQEQNSYAGLTNKLLAKRAKKICVAFDGMDKYFPGKKIIMTGNPVRKEIENINKDDFRQEGYTHFGLEEARKTILVLGGSLGAGTINRGVIENLDKISESDIQVLWQCGKYYHEEAKQAIHLSGLKNMIMKDFISRMDLAYAVADIIICRAGAITISELCHVGKPVILGPSPNVAEDHQTKNALSLAEKSAAIHLPDREAIKQMIPMAMDLLKDESRMKSMSEKISQLAEKDSAGRIAGEVIAFLGN